MWIKNIYKWYQKINAKQNLTQNIDAAASSEDNILFDP